MGNTRTDTILLGELICQLYKRLKFDPRQHSNQNLSRKIRPTKFSTTLRYNRITKSRPEKPELVFTKDLAIVWIFRSIGLLKWKDRQVPGTCKRVEKKRWNLKVTEIPIEVRTLRTVSKAQEKDLRSDEAK